MQANVGLSWPHWVRAGLAHDHAGSMQGDAMVVDFGDSVLLQCPTPDFSMPYNVITLTCTVLALFFGRSCLHNLLSIHACEGSHARNFRARWCLWLCR